ncbi:polysaccharide biosynthesis protein [Actinomyces bowdenii]|uniref:Polysaccharide biosynthesis protein n=2 Tax=Actinomyces bowdenii TaxID=131109 RepID=A0A3P1UQ12_9ACTO|nr:polysaccharide biosynthesis protein [Actinomyces bowdenii]MBO3724570.1 polysaccharide biosynthesis protein [Actinomyces bowdenii]RRD23668.1 polysaccharide biosynthesis protein [Actinomyces bowdenii]
MLWNSAGSITRLGCNYMLSIVVVWLSRGFDAAGVLTLAVAVSNLVTPFADFRLRTLQVTDVKGERSSGAYVGLRIATTALAFAAGAVYALATTALDAFPVIILYLIYSLAANFIEVLHAIDQRHRRMDYIGRSYMMQGLLSFTGFCLGLWLTNSLEVAVGLMAVATIAIGVLYDAPRAALFEPLRPQIDIRPALRILAGLLPLVIAQVCSSAVLVIPRQYLAATSGESDLGIYNSIAAPVLLVQTGAAFVYGPLMGEFAEKFQTDKRGAMRLLRKTTLLLLAVTGLIALVLLLVGEPLLELVFGPEILPHVGLLQPTLLCTIMTAFAWFMNDLLLALRDYTASFVGNALAALTTLALSTTIVDAFGMNGISWMGVIAYGIAVLSLLAFLMRDYRRLEA